MSTGQTWDVVVVGGGPAGAAAARTAAQTGARTLLLEREHLPRYKRCGGGLIGLSQAAVADAGVDVAALSRDVVGRMTFTSRGRHAYTREAEPFLPMVVRAELDEALVQAAADAGAAVRDGTTVTGYTTETDGVRLTTSGGELRARAVVGADGSGSRAAAHVGVACESVDLGMEAELPVPPGTDWQGHVLLDWGPVPGSYGWVFPKGDRLTVGVIGARERGGDVRAYFRSFVASLGLDIADGEHVGGHLTRVRTTSSPLRRGRVLVAGDAAGLLEPWTREGISFALRSGALAGAAAVGGSSYESAVDRVLGDEMAAGRRALAAFTRHPRAVHEVLRRGPGMWPRFRRLVSGGTTMPEQLSRLPVRALVTALGG
ncbi:MAG TPA: geranylgeranyl reductase family protein [Mycobacteriales bacterium]|nr:geranylgeranyl reductase family protein [Mycobacteriales bacterium]